MVVGARIDFLLQQMCNSHRIAVSFLPNDNEQKLKMIKMIVKPQQQTVSSDVSITMCSVLESIRNMTAEYTTVDRGHKHTDGTMEVCLWMRSKSTAAKASPSTVTRASTPISLQKVLCVAPLQSEQECDPVMPTNSTSTMRPDAPEFMPASLSSHLLTEVMPLERAESNVTAEENRQGKPEDAKEKEVEDVDTSAAEQITDSNAQAAAADVNFWELVDPSRRSVPDWLSEQSYIHLHMQVALRAETLMREQGNASLRPIVANMTALTQKDVGEAS